MGGNRSVQLVHKLYIPLHSLHFPVINQSQDLLLPLPSKQLTYTATLLSACLCCSTSRKCWAIFSHCYWARAFSKETVMPLALEVYMRQVISNSLRKESHSHGLALSPLLQPAPSCSVSDSWWEGGPGYKCGHCSCVSQYPRSWIKVWAKLNEVI